MIAATKVPCAGCGHFNPPDDVACGMCGDLLRPEPAAPAEAAPVIHLRPAVCEPPRTAAKYLLLGAALAPLLLLPPVLNYVGWFLGALCHETGHCAAAWAAGCPAVPVISLHGHAMATHGGQSLFLCVVWWGLLAWFAWTYRHRRRGLWVLGPAALLYPLFAFTGLRELIFLVGGHVGELAFAGVFFWRALVGGFSDSRAERVTYAAVGWFLVGRNLWLASGLLWDEQIKAWYRAGGSYGLTNDYIRVARDVLGVDLGVVAGFMLLATVAVIPAAWLLTRGRLVGR